MVFIYTQKHGCKLLKSLRVQCLCESVRHVARSVNVKELDELLLNVLPHEVEPDVDVLRHFVVHLVLGDESSTLVVDEDGYRGFHREKLTH